MFLGGLVVTKLGVMVECSDSHIVYKANYCICIMSDDRMSWI